MGEDIGMREKKSYSLYSIFVCWLLITLTVVSSVCKVKIGLDVDESYITYLAYRLQRGMVLFKDSWDMHTTSAVIPALLLKAFLFFENGRMDGAILFLRIVSCLFQWLAALFAFYIFNKNYSGKVAFAVSLVIANMLPRATQNFEYGFESTLFLLFFSLIILDVWKNKEEEKYLKIILASVSYAIALFIYPTMIMTLPVVLAVFILKIDVSGKMKVRYTALFIMTCFLLFCVMLFYLFKNMTFSELVDSIKGILMAGDHTGLFSVFGNAKVILKLVLRCAGLLIIPIVIYAFLRRKYELSIFFLNSVYCIEMLLVVFIPNITGIRQSGVYGLLERYIVIAILAVVVSVKSIKDREILWLFVLTGFMEFLGALAGSNLGFCENAMFLELVLAAYAFQSMCYLEKNAAGNSFNLAVAKIGIVCFLLDLILSKAYFVRISGTGPANIFEPRAIAENGIYSGLMVDEKWLDTQKNRASFIDQKTQDEKKYALVSNDPCLNFYFNGEMTAPQYAPTLSTGEQWVYYYTKAKNELPDEIWIDETDYGVDKFYNSDLGKYVSDSYSVKNSENGFLILSK